MQLKKLHIILSIAFTGFLVANCEKEKKVITQINPETPSVHKLSNEQLLDTLQLYTFKYFWDFAHPSSGMIRERSNGDNNIVTSGGSGFGVMAIIVGIERGFISREEGADRILKITNFLLNSDRFHGAFPHWYKANSGKVQPFSSLDNGGDIVETAFMIQGLLTAKSFFNLENEKEDQLRLEIQTLWEDVEWDWYLQSGKNVITWHWSPNYNFQINLDVSGYNESLIVYVLAASSPTYPIEASTYHSGWARNGAIRNNKRFYDINLPLGEDKGGPLFFSHYSFLGLNPRGLSDTYANYEEQNVNHTLINRQYCIENPKGWQNYSAVVWGLTASDNHRGYSAHSPNNDLGVITPSAAISAIPYTPDYSFQVLRHFYENLKEKTWGSYGFYDAFNQTENWYSKAYLAIDQGPIIIMVENYRTQLLWNHFMNNEEVISGLQKLGFIGPNL